MEPKPLNYVVFVLCMLVGPHNHNTNNPTLPFQHSLVAPDKHIMNLGNKAKA